MLCKVNYHHKLGQNGHLGFVKYITRTPVRMPGVFIPPLRINKFQQLNLLSKTKVVRYHLRKKFDKSYSLVTLPAHWIIVFTIISYELRCILITWSALIHFYFTPFKCPDIPRASQDTCRVIVLGSALCNSDKYFFVKYSLGIDMVFVLPLNDVNFMVTIS
jgi:hypothetical protein